MNDIESLKDEIERVISLGDSSEIKNICNEGAKVIL